MGPTKNVQNTPLTTDWRSGSRSLALVLACSPGRTKETAATATSLGCPQRRRSLWSSTTTDGSRQEGEGETAAVGAKAEGARGEQEGAVVTGQQGPTRSNTNWKVQEWSTSSFLSSCSVWVEQWQKIKVQTKECHQINYKVRGGK